MFTADRLNFADARLNKLFGEALAINAGLAAAKSLGGGSLPAKRKAFNARLTSINAELEGIAQKDYPDVWAGICADRAESARQAAEQQAFNALQKSLKLEPLPIPEIKRYYQEQADLWALQQEVRGRRDRTVTPLASQSDLLDATAFFIRELAIPRKHLPSLSVVPPMTANAQWYGKYYRDPNAIEIKSGRSYAETIETIAHELVHAREQVDGCRAFSEEWAESEAKRLCALYWQPEMAA